MRLHVGTKQSYAFTVMNYDCNPFVINLIIKFFSRKCIYKQHFMMVVAEGRWSLMGVAASIITESTVLFVRVFCRLILFRSGEV